MAIHTTSKILAQAVDTVSSTQGDGLPLGETVTTNIGFGGEAIYIEALSILSEFNWVVIAEDHKASNMTTANLAAAGIGWKVGVVQQSVPSGSFAWAHTSGKVQSKIATHTVPRVPLFATTTPGEISDATLSAGYLPGVYTVTSTSTASVLTTMMATRSFVFPWSNPV